MSGYIDLKYQFVCVDGNDKAIESDWEPEEID